MNIHVTGTVQAVKKEQVRVDRKMLISSSKKNIIDWSLSWGSCWIQCVVSSCHWGFLYATTNSCTFRNKATIFLFGWQFCRLAKSICECIHIFSPTSQLHTFYHWEMSNGNSTLYKKICTIVLSLLHAEFAGFERGFKNARRSFHATNWNFLG